MKAPGGFEPPLRDKPEGESEVHEPSGQNACELPADLQRIVARLTRAVAADARVNPQG